ncbi:lipopolysaccharide biosynthesis protein RfbH [Amycolatopsis antarctica]|uniref:Lipopolysaccharide biosynthesis protein RfbH n=1 Tax=Amycolatopsis antarctica TaxID=1854586 RepID=A0A263D9K2_9PSEU|nr:lipopolysaccharide biosynthesis protein RfbH [Amycolatopsis antarctica]OZM74156.1 lipopolysaccharide biosynthesis protein RfbH [Amycolatopsis antarctica]
MSGTNFFQSEPRVQETAGAGQRGGAADPASVDEPDIKSTIMALTRKFGQDTAAAREFRPGVTPILTSGAVLDDDDRVALVGAALEMRIAAGVLSRQFERKFARKLGLRKAHLTNSGSSANLLALAALCSPSLDGQQLRPGDEVVTVAAGFPTTVNPIVQLGLVPVFVDVELGTYNTTPERVEAAIGPRTRAVMIAHALGNPFQAEEIAQIANQHGLYFVEDNCDGVGSTYNGATTGGFGDLSTVSFYPAHHITTGEGGCVLTANLALARIVESLRDWGRDCWCEPGENDTCRKRFGYQMGELPMGYDHKYIFSEVGYNLKGTDLQASLALSQLAKLDSFGATRRRNWHRLRAALDDVPHLLLPVATPNSDPSWFGFAVTVEADAPFARSELVHFLENRKIGTRLLFAGNLTRHPAYLRQPYRISETLDNSDVVTERTFWVGVYPGITDEMVDYMATSIREFVAGAS